MGARYAGTHTYTQATSVICVCYLLVSACVCGCVIYPVVRTSALMPRGPSIKRVILIQCVNELHINLSPKMAHLAQLCPSPSLPLSYCCFPHLSLCLCFSFCVRLSADIHWRSSKWFARARAEFKLWWNGSCICEKSGVVRLVRECKYEWGFTGNLWYDTSMRNIIELSKILLLMSKFLLLTDVSSAF